jgi:uncharacterized membrane protein HdeD (DUF308 family)
MMQRTLMTKKHSASPGWWLLLLQGVLLIALAGLVLYRPEILIHLVAAMLIAAGICSMVLAWHVRRLGRATVYRYWSEWWWADAL